MKMKRILLIIFILISLAACAQKPQPEAQLQIPSFPNPSPRVLVKLTELNDYEVNAWLIKINEFKKELNKLR